MKHKKIISIVLCICMMLTLMPSMAMADAVAYIPISNAIEQNDGNVDPLTLGGENTTTKYALTSDVSVYRIIIEGNVELLLQDGYTLEVSSNVAVTEGNSLTIYGEEEGTGKLHVLNAGKNSVEAGIGGTRGNGEKIPDLACGTITINGGTVIAESTDGAGIGGGQNIIESEEDGKGGYGGTITINGGTVTATSQTGAGIGGGNNGNCGTVIINGGNVTATSKTGAGIGGGQKALTNGYGGDGGTVTITDGIVAATSETGAGIGGGINGNGGYVTISGGVVTATASEQEIGYEYAKGIGHGLDERDGYVSDADKLSSGTIIMNGNGFVMSAIDDDNQTYIDGLVTRITSGVFFDGISRYVYGSTYGTEYTLTNDVTIPSDYTLDVGRYNDDGELVETSTFIVEEGVTLTVNGVINNNRSTIKIDGAIDGSGKIYNYGGTIMGREKIADTVTVVDYYVITFKFNNGTNDYEYTVEAVNGSGTLDYLPSLDSTDEYDFSGWFTEEIGGTKVDTNTVVNANTTLYARWVCNHSGATFSYIANEDGATHSQVCSRCTEAVGESEAHDYTDNADTGCNTCGYVRSLTHDFTNGAWVTTDSTYHWKVCKDCTEEDTANKALHSFDNACDTTCDVCGHTRTITHEYTKLQTNTAEHWYVCAVCDDEQFGSRAAHEYVNACDVDCDCGYTRTITHNYTWVIDKTATESETGLKHEECTICHEKRSENTVIDKLPATQQPEDNTPSTPPVVDDSDDDYDYGYDDSDDSNSSSGSSGTGGSGAVVPTTPSKPEITVTKPTTTIVTPDNNTVVKDVVVEKAEVSDTVMAQAEQVIAEEEHVQMIGGSDSAVSITATTEDNDVVIGFTEPLTVTVPVDRSDIRGVKDTGKLTLAKVVTDEDGTTDIVYVGGNYDKNTGTFTALINEPGDYILVENADIQKIELQIGNAGFAVNGNASTNDVSPINYNNRTMVGIRYIAEIFGGKVGWDGATRTVTIEIDGKVLTMVIDQMIPGFDTPAIIHGNRTMVPLRYISDAVGANVIYSPSTQGITVVK